MANYVRRAYFYAAASETTYIELLEEDMTVEDVEMDRIGVLNLAMYGTRSAAAAWQDTVVEFMKSVGFKRGRTNPCIFYNAEKDVRTIVHGDDFLSAGAPDQLTWLDECLKQRFEIKTARIGEEEEEKDMRILNRIVRVTEDGIEYEPDPRHAELIVEELKLQNAKAVATPGEKLTVTDSPKLGAMEVTRYRSICARINYLAQDRADITYMGKELCRRMSEPTEADWQVLKRLGRYLKGKPRMIQHFGWQAEGAELEVDSDTDHAGCTRTRKSTSGDVYCAAVIA